MAGKDKDKDDTPEGGISPLAVAAAQMHELYVELRGAGFTRGEALTLVVKMSSGDPDA